VRVDVLGKITECILGGLVYLYEAHRIMHRDIKPSNVLVNSRGMIKLCDFGVATETVNSVANTFVGTSTYMAPERIKGDPYTVKSDVWSVGLTIMELAIGRFPFDANDSAPGDRASAGPMGILDLLQQIVHEPAPKLPKSEAFPAILDDFVAKCLLKNPDERPTPRELYDKDLFLQAAKRTPVDLQEWAVSMMERHNRKSYLAPPAPKSLKSDGTGSDTQTTPATSATSNSSFGQENPAKTPVTARMMGGTTPSAIDVSTMPKTASPHYPAITGSSHNSNTPTGIAQKSPPPGLSLQHLSLETNDAVNDNIHRFPSLGGRGDNIPEPASAIEPSGRPMFPPRTSSSTSINSHGRLGTGAAALSSRLPPPSGPLPPPPPSKELPAIPTGGLASPRRGR
jgi:mitogen-activated protein kinase kinase